MPKATRVKAKVAIPIGLDNIHIALMTSDVAGQTTTYGNPEYFARAIKATLTPILKNGSLDSDDSVEIDESEIVGYTVSIDESQLDDYMRAKIFGHTVDVDGGIIINKDDVPPTLALLFRSKLSDHQHFKNVVLYKGTFKKNTEEFETDKKDSTTYKTETIEGTFYARESDGNIKYDLREDNTAASATKIANWFTAVQEPGEAATASASNNEEVENGGES